MSFLKEKLCGNLCTLNFQCKNNALKSVIKYLLVFILIITVFNVNATVYYVSSSGSDSNSGTSPNQAWKSLAKVNNKWFLRGDQILFKKGDSWSGYLKVHNSGGVGRPIVYGAYGTGSKPKIYGSEVITGWTVHSGNIYKATFTKDITQLFIDDIRVRAARHPNNGVLEITEVVSLTQFRSSDLPDGINYEGANVHIKTNEWHLDPREVTFSSGQLLGIDEKTRSGNYYIRSGNYGLKVGQDFFLTNKLDFLDEAGEWYYDTSTNTVYLWTPNGDTPASYTIRGSVEANGVVIDRKHNITIKDFNVLQQQEVGILVDNSIFVTLNNNNIADIEERGIKVSGKRNTITNNTVDGVNHVGLSCIGGNSLISDNVITDVGLFDDLGLNGMPKHNTLGMNVSGDHNIIRYNRIINSSYQGISFTGQYTTIEYNYIDNVCSYLTDGGAIYTYSTNINETIVFGSVIKNNIVLNSYEGIYMDERTRDVIIENNTVAYCDGRGIFMHDDKNIEARYNTLFGNYRGLRATLNFGGNYFHHNIIYGQDNGETGNSSQLMITRHPDDDNTSLDSNTYINHYYENPFWDTKAYNVHSFAGWKSNMKQDYNSTFDNTPLAEGETEHLFYNDTKQAKNINLGSFIYRDIYGNQVFGTLKLDPFTSKILIKTDENIANRNPVINVQSFNIEDIKQTNEFIGTVIASDPDDWQTLTFSITGGNTEDLFYINSSTGEIFANKKIHFENDTYIDLILEVSDDATTPLSASATVTINITGIELPGKPNPICIDLDFVKGWNIFSVNNNPDSLDIEYIFQSLIDNNSLIKIQDELGNSLEDWGVFGGWKNNLDNLAPTEGYKIKVDHDVSLQVCGSSIELPYSIPLYSGWNIIGFPHLQEANGMDVVQQLIDDGSLVKLQDEQGNSIEDWGVFGGWKNNVGNLAPGKGYKVKVNGNSTLLIKESYPKSTTINPNHTETIHFETQYVGNGINHMNINIVALPQSIFEVGDELAVFDGEICVGTKTILPKHLSNQTISIPVSAMDDISPFGFVDNNYFNIVLWKSRQKQEFELNPEIVKGPHVFTKNESVILSFEKYAITGIDGLSVAGLLDLNYFPNPFVEKIKIEIRVPEESKIQVVILNQLGQKVKTLAYNKQFPNGLVQLSWDGKNNNNTQVSPGIYLLNILIGETNYYEKIIYSNQ